MSYIPPLSRFQNQLFSSLDDQIDEHNPIRILDLFVEKVIAANPENFFPQVIPTEGRPGFGPEVFLKLYLYGYLHGISSSRKLEAEARRNLEVMWLLSGLKPHYWVISNYRKENKKAIRFITLEFRLFLKEKGFIKGNFIHYDGCKIKANANRNMLSLAKTNKHLEQAEQDLDSYLEELSRNDEVDEICGELNADSTQKPEREAALLGKIDELKQKIELMNEQKNLMESLNKNYISLTDPDCSLMRSRDGKLPCFNLQGGVDQAFHMIALAEVTDAPVDRGLLSKDLKDTEEQIDLIPKNAGADTGYYVPDDIERAEKEGKTTCYVNVQADSFAKQKKAEEEAGISFTWNEQNNEYQCSQGQSLPLLHKNKKEGSHLVDVYRGKNCKQCPLMKICTSSKYGKSIRRRHNQEWIDQYKERMSTDQAKAVLAHRKHTVEHPFGTLKYRMGHIPLLLRGIPGVQAEIDLYTTGYNFTRLINIESFQKIIQMMNNYDWRSPKTKQRENNHKRKIG